MLVSYLQYFAVSLVIVLVVARLAVAWACAS